MIKKSRVNLIVSVALAILPIAWTALSAESSRRAGDVTNKRVEAADSESGSWLVHGRDFGEQFFSPLSQIDQANVKRLGVAWSTEIDSLSGLVSQPLMIDGVIYISGMNSTVTALEAGSGKILWQFIPEDLKFAQKGNTVLGVWGFTINRGVAVWDGKVFVGTGDCRLIAIDAATGKQNWESPVCDISKGYTITGAPRVANGKVFMGSAGSDLDARGFVAAFDAKGGRELWRFHTVPAMVDGKFESDFMTLAARTWDEGQWKVGGASVWNSMTYDPEFNRLYFGTSCVGPLNPTERNKNGGDELFECAIVAVDADTGKYAWHFSVNPRFGWDYDAVMPIVLADLTIDGTKRKVLMQAPKNGFFFVLDRATGKFISAKNYTKVTWATGFTPQGRPILSDDGKYWEKPGGRAVVYPSELGGHSIQPMSYSPKTGLVYIPTCEFGNEYKLSPTGGAFGGIEVDILNYKPGAANTPKELGKLVAWNPVTQTQVWSHSYPTPCNGGTMSTATNLVFQGDTYGVARAFNAQNGNLLWSQALGSSIQSAPISYSYRGQQYVLFLTGFGGAGRQMWPEFANAGPSRVVALKVGGKGKIPQFVNRTLPPPAIPDTAYAKDPTEIVRGEHLFQTKWCVLCHGMHARIPAGDSRFPDLRQISKETYDDWHNIVLGGSRNELGMFSFKDSLSPKDATAIRDYVVHQAHEDYDHQQQPKNKKN